MGSRRTRRISFISRPVSFFIAAMSFRNLRIVYRPKVGTWRNLDKISIQILFALKTVLPFIKLSDPRVSMGIKDTNEVRQGCFPYAKFEFMKEIDNKYGVYVETMCSKFCRKYVLETLSAWNNICTIRTDPSWSTRLRIHPLYTTNF